MSDISLILNAEDIEAEVLAEALMDHDFDDWYIALLSVALDESADLGTALEVANETYFRVPENPTEEKEGEDDLALNASYFGRCPRDERGWCMSADEGGGGGGSTRPLSTREQAIEHTVSLAKRERPKTVDGPREEVSLFNGDVRTVNRLLGEALVLSDQASDAEGAEAADLHAATAVVLERARYAIANAFLSASAIKDPSKRQGTILNGFYPALNEASHAHAKTYAELSDWGVLPDTRYQASRQGEIWSYPLNEEGQVIWSQGVVIRNVPKNLLVNKSEDGWEYLSNAEGGENCGTGAGGFKKGNTCAKGSGARQPKEYEQKASEAVSRLMSMSLPESQNSHYTDAVRRGKEYIQEAAILVDKALETDDEKEALYYRALATDALASAQNQSYIAIREGSPSLNGDDKRKVNSWHKQIGSALVRHDMAISELTGRDPEEPYVYFLEEHEHGGYEIAGRRPMLDPLGHWERVGYIPKEYAELRFTANSYFSRCPRDERGWCMASDEGGGGGELPKGEDRQEKALINAWKYFAHDELNWKALADYYEEQGDQKKADELRSNWEERLTWEDRVEKSRRYSGELAYVAYFRESGREPDDIEFAELSEEQAEDPEGHFPEGEPHLDVYIVDEEDRKVFPELDVGERIRIYTDERGYANRVYGHFQVY